jgi:hypothetical protein
LLPICAGCATLKGCSAIDAPWKSAPIRYAAGIIKDAPRPALGGAGPAQPPTSPNGPQTP